jgi:hypothetical protein
MGGLFFVVIISIKSGYKIYEVAINIKIWYSLNLCWLKLPLLGGKNDDRNTRDSIMGCSVGCDYDTVHRGAGVQ